ncbi:MAG: HAD family hydrolase [Nitrospirota bacterium]
MKLLLFDIDGTLLDSGGAGTKAMNLAFEEVFSIPDAFNGIDMAGKTDTQIMKEGMKRHNISSDNGRLPSLCKSYISHLLHEIKNPAKHLKPGIVSTLDSLRAIKGLYLGLLTGNIETGARIKLDAFGLNSYFSFGAFGNDHEERNSLLPVAIKQFRSLYQKDACYTDCIVIGDTPRDVECAKVHGALSVAVATGPYSYKTLVKSDADMVLYNLLDYNLTELMEGKKWLS